MSEENDDLAQLLPIADEWGYWRCIQYLKEAWADKLVMDGLPPHIAAKSALMDEDEVQLYIAKLKT